MMNDMSIKPLAMISPSTGSVQQADPGTSSEQVSFGKWLNQSMEKVDKFQQEADVAAEKLITGENKDIHGTMIAMQKASISMSLMLEVRNKIINAYEEIKRMQF
jgi:flagellar hook-basal body complex protein FliE